MNNEKEYNNQYLTLLIEETLKQTESDPITIRSVLDIPTSAIFGEEYFQHRMNYFAEIFAFRAIYNLRALKVLMPQMVGSDNKGFLFPVNLIMRNLITDFLTSLYLFTKFRIYQNSDNKDNADLIQTFSSINEKIYKQLIDSNNKEEIKLLKAFLPECSIEKEKGSSPLMPKQIKDWFNKKETYAEKNTIETIDRCYGVYDKYFSKFEHITFLTTQLYIQINPFPYHSDAILAGINQIMNCYVHLGKSVEFDNIVKIIKTTKL